MSESVSFHFDVDPRGRAEEERVSVLGFRLEFGVQAGIRQVRSGYGRVAQRAGTQRKKGHTPIEFCVCALLNMSDEGTRSTLYPVQPSPSHQNSGWGRSQERGGRTAPSPCP